MTQNNMKIIGITGGVGSGKSYVLKYLQDAYQATVVQADQVGKLVQQAGNDAFIKIVEEFGELSVGKDGELDRGYLAQVIYEDETKRQLMNNIVHPIVRQFITEQIEIERAYGTSYFIIEAAILIESKFNELCDEVWFIYADEETRIKRLISSRDYSEEKCRMIIASQLPYETFMEVCDVCIDNSSSPEYTYKQIDEQFLRIKEEQTNEVM